MAQRACISRLASACQPQGSMWPGWSAARCTSNIRQRGIVTCTAATAPPPPREDTHQHASTSGSPADAAQQARHSRFLPGIQLIVGPMFAGKSSELLRRVAEFEAQGRRVLVIKSHKDTRYHAHRVVTHDGVSKSCHSVRTMEELVTRLGAEYQRIEVFAIDEAQFFGDLMEFCLRAADHDGKLVLVAGLDGDFRRQRFGQVLDMLPLADSVTKLTSQCAYCSEAALFSLRTVGGKEQEVVGGADLYQPVCRRHYAERSSAEAPGDIAGLLRAFAADTQA